MYSANWSLKNNQDRKYGERIGILKLNETHVLIKSRPYLFIYIYIYVYSVFPISFPWQADACQETPCFTFCLGFSRTWGTCRDWTMCSQLLQCSNLGRQNRRISIEHAINTINIYKHPTKILQWVYPCLSCIMYPMNIQWTSNISDRSCRFTSSLHLELMMLDLHGEKPEPHALSTAMHCCKAFTTV